MNNWTVALRADGTVVGLRPSYPDPPEFPTDLPRVRDLATTDEFTLLVLEDGSIWHDGAEAVNGCSLHESFDAVTDGIQIVANRYCALVLAEEGNLAVCGATPLELPDNVAQIAAGVSHVLVLLQDGSLLSWNYDGQLMELPTDLGVIAHIGCGDDYSLVLGTDGKMKLWGDNFYVADYPRELEDVIAISPGHHHCVALTESGQIVAWGDNRNNELVVPEGYPHTLGVVAARNRTYAWTDVPVFVRHPEFPRGVRAGESHILEVVVTSSEAFDLQWYFNEEPIEGATGSSLPLSNVQAEAVGSYFVRAENSHGISRSETARLESVIATHPRVIWVTPPHSQLLVNEGERFEMEVSVSGSEPIGFQWMFNGEPIPGEIQTRLVLDPVGSEHAGSYRLVATNALDDDSSTTLELSVFPLPRLVTDLESRTVAAGMPVVFSLEATGGEPMAWRWEKNGEAIEGANTEVLSIASAQLDAAGRYRAVLSNAAGTIMSREVVLTVTPSAPGFLGSPRSWEVYQGNSVRLEAPYFGSDPVRFQWRKGDMDIRGATSPLWVLHDLTPDDSGDYRLIVSNVLGEAVSEPVRVHVRTLPIGTIDWPNPTLVEITQGVKFPPTVITHAGDDSGRLFLADAYGLVWIFREGIRNPDPFLDVFTKVEAGSKGIRGLAFSPNYRQDGEFYVHYVQKGARAALLSRFKVSADDPDRADPDSEEVLMQVDSLAHFVDFGGGLTFGPDGYLYVGFGVGSGLTEGVHPSQDCSQWSGKVLRIDVVGISGGYRIPQDNPFIRKPGCQPEIWALGVRNPREFSFDPATGDFFFNDLGSEFNEINIQSASSRGAANFGWNAYQGDGLRVGFQPINGVVNTPPLVTRSQVKSNEAAPYFVGGSVYRGLEFPRMQGVYFYAVRKEDTIMAMKYDGSGWQHRLLRRNIDPTAIGEDQEGNIYVNYPFLGALYRIQDTNRAAPPCLTPDWGTYDTELAVRVLPGTVGSTIRYTLDESEPDESSPEWNPDDIWWITKNYQWISVRAYMEGMEPSQWVRRGYTLNIGLNPAPAADLLPLGTQIEIVPSTEGVEILYTTDGSSPDDSGQIYKGPLVLNRSLQLKARGYKEGFEPGMLDHFFGLVDYVSVIVESLAGSSEHGFRDGPSHLARFSSPQAIKRDAWGNLYVADKLNHCIRRIDPNGFVSTWAGNGEAGFQDGPGAEARFNEPVGLTFDPAGVLQVADTRNYRIRKIDPEGNVSTYAGTGQKGIVDGDITIARFKNLSHLEQGNDGMLYVADDATIRQITHDGQVSLLSNAIAGWSLAFGMAQLMDGSLIANMDNGRVFQVLGDGNQAAYAGIATGHADGPRLESRLSDSGVTRDCDTDKFGMIYLADSQWIRRITPEGQVQTLTEYADTGNPSLPFNQVTGICAAEDGVLYVTDSRGHQVYRVSSDADWDRVPDFLEISSEVYQLGVDDRELDADSDGVSNSEEYWAGTDPSDPQSTLRLDILRNSEGFELAWPAPPGTPFILETSLDLGFWWQVNQEEFAPGRAFVPQSGEAVRYFRLRLPESY